MLLIEDERLGLRTRRHAAMLDCRLVCHFGWEILNRPEGNAGIESSAARFRIRGKQHILIPGRRLALTEASLMAL